MSDEHGSTWGTQSGSGRLPEYDRNHFYTKSTNKHNHSSSIRPFDHGTAGELGLPKNLSIPFEMVAEVHQVVNNPRFPYRSIQDLCRDALVHRLHDLAEMEQDESYLNWFDGEAFKQALMQIRQEDHDFYEAEAYYANEVEAFRRDENSHGIADVIAAWRQYRPPLRLVKKWMEAAGRWEQIQRQVEQTVDL